MNHEVTDHPELVEFEGETLGDTLTNLITEVKRLRKALYWVSGEETRVDVGYMWETVEMILDGRIDGPYGFDDNDDWAKLLEDTLLAKRNINKDDSTNSKYPEEGEKESE